MVNYNNKNENMLQKENMTANKQESMDKVQSMISTIFQMPLETDMDIDIAYKNMKEDLLNAVKELIEENQQKEEASVEEKAIEEVETKEEQIQILKEENDKAFEETFEVEVEEVEKIKEEQPQTVEPTLVEEEEQQKEDASVEKEEVAEAVETKEEQPIEETFEEETEEVLEVKEEQSQTVIPISKENLEQSLFIHIPLSQLVIEQNQIVGIKLLQSQVAVTVSEPQLSMASLKSQSVIISSQPQVDIESEPQITDTELPISELAMEEEEDQDASDEESSSEVLIEEEQSSINLQSLLSDKKNDIKSSQQKYSSVVKDKGLMIMKNPKSSFSEAIKSIRTNLQFAAVDKEIKTILVTSPEPGDGKSSISSNLAGAYAQDNKKVLIIDCDLRKGRQAEIFGANKYMTGGYTNLILNYKEDDSFNIEDYIEKTNIENIELISNGPVPPNPIELLASEKNREVLKELENNYDIIILDCPPVLGLSDTLIMTKYSDANIVVISKGKTKVELLAEVKKHFAKANTTITGVILNKAKQKHNSYYGYYGEV